LGLAVRTALIGFDDEQLNAIDESVIVKKTFRIGRNPSVAWPSRRQRIEEEVQIWFNRPKRVRKAMNTFYVLTVVSQVCGGSSPCLMIDSAYVRPRLNVLYLTLGECETARTNFLDSDRDPHYQCVAVSTGSPDR
jgi:hypothetical protein